jgi:dihydrofolate reductase
VDRKNHDQTLGSRGEYSYKDKKNKCLAKTSYKKEKDSDIKFVVDLIKFVKQLTQSDGKDVWIVGAQI